jgi:hypothetical protein
MPKLKGKPRQKPVKVDEAASLEKKVEKLVRLRELRQQVFFKFRCSLPPSLTSRTCHCPKPL